MNTITGSMEQGQVVARRSQTKVMATGFALFAMFFGAGNIVFALFLGANAGHYILPVAICFLVVGVGTPMLGLISTSLYQGDYWSFFSRLGRVPGFLLATFLMVFIGPLTAAPRTEIITYQSLLPYLPQGLNNSWVFSALFCGVTFLCAYRETKIIDVIGVYITPVKLACFGLLILLGVVYAGHMFTGGPLVAEHTIVAKSVAMGYGTMDMLGAFFFATIAVRAIASKVNPDDCPNGDTQPVVIKRMLSSCLIAGGLLAVVYFGFMVTAYHHSADLQGLRPDQMLYAISVLILGNYGSLFVGVCVTFACLATSIALADVTSTFLYEYVVAKKVPRLVCMAFVLTLMYLMTQLGFSGIMHFAYPVLQVIYPALILLCVINILHRVWGFKSVKLPVAAAVVVSAFFMIFG